MFKAIVNRSEKLFGILRRSLNYNFVSTCNPAKIYKKNNILLILINRAFSNSLQCSMCTVQNNYQTFKMASEDTKVLKEGKAEMHVPHHVFYNPIQEFNRDLTIAVISKFSNIFLMEKDDFQVKKKGKKRGDNKQFETNPVTSENSELLQNEQDKDGITILEGLSASGIRSMRFGLEIPDVRKIVANDLQEAAVEMIKKNVEVNSLAGLVEPSHGDACKVMYDNKEGFDVIDLDPYGSPAMFLDGAVQAVSEGGLLCITATDMANLCGNAPEACYSKYGSMCVRAPYCHEMALRILLQCVNAHANHYSRYIVPQISIHADFYIRIFVRVYTGAYKMKESVTKLAMVHHCGGCGDFHIQRLAEKIPTKGDNFKVVPCKGSPVCSTCEHCNHKYSMVGPVWADPIHNKEFVRNVLTYVQDNSGLLNTEKRIAGMLNVIEEELEDPLYWVGDDIFKKLHSQAIQSTRFRSAILNAGYEVSFSHAHKDTLKTNAPTQLIWDILREHVKTNPISAKRRTPGSVVDNILSKEQKFTVDFSLHPRANPASKKNNVLRYQANPEKNWGPQSRPGKNKQKMEDKRERLQNKRKIKDQDKDTNDKVMKTQVP